MNHVKRTNKLARRSLPALAAVGGSLAALPAAAIQLGDITVQSRLGQPLRASIAFALAPNEQVSDYCITMRPGASLSGLPNVGDATISVANGVIMLSGKTPLREPMVSAHVVINCPYAANLSREYMLFIDPAEPAYETATITQQSTADAAPVVVRQAPVAAPVVRTPESAPVQRAQTRRSAPLQKDISSATTYTVKSGDTLSGIAQRIENRGVGLWAAVDAIFEANPNAFINNDINLIKLGSTLTIPSFVGDAAEVTESRSSAVASKAVEPIATSATAAEPASAQPEVVQPDVTTGDLLPGDVETSDNPFVETAADGEAGSSETVVIPDTQLEGPTTTSASPNVPTAVITSASASNVESATPSWVLWLAGSGVALIIGLLMFGRRLRRSPEPAPIAAAPLAVPGERRRQSDSGISVEETSAHDLGFIRDTSVVDTANVPALDDTQNLADDSPTEENIALDAELVVSSDLEDTQEAVSPPKYGFAEAPEVDVELPFEPVESVSDQTDILPPLRTDEFTILDSEVFIDDDEDVSSVIDSLSDTVETEVAVERESNVVQIKSIDETMATDSYTINDEADIRKLEQDYEDEFTATQALNKEIERAAAEIAEKMERDAEDSDATSALPLASVTELDITAQMPAQNDAESSVEETGITQALNLDDTGLTQELNLDDIVDDATVEMPAKKSK